MMIFVLLQDSYSNRTKYITNYIGATMPVLFLAAAFSGHKPRVKDKKEKKKTDKSTPTERHTPKNSRRSHSQGTNHVHEASTD